MDSLIHMNNHMKSATIQTEKSSRIVWFFQHSKYQIHILDFTNPYPHYKVYLQNQIQLFQIITVPHQQNQGTYSCYLVIVNNVGVWMAYQVHLSSDGKQISIIERAQSLLQDIDQKVVGIHLLEPDQKLVVFVKANGYIQYNFLDSNDQQLDKKTDKHIKQEYKIRKTLKTNKVYEIQADEGKQVSKGKNKNNNPLYSKFKGQELIQTKNENKIINSKFNIKTRELFTLTQDLNSGVCSLGRYFLHDYEIMTGTDFLLNLPSSVLQICLWSNICMVNLGSKILLWSRNITQFITFPQLAQSVCTCMQQVDKQMFLCTVHDTTTNQVVVYSITLTLTPQDSTKISDAKIQRFYTPKSQDMILQFIPIQYPKSLPWVQISNKLELIMRQSQRQGSQKTILTNMQTEILRARFTIQKYSSYLRVIKKVGYSVEEKFITNNRVVSDLQEYQHNILIKMSNLLDYCANYLNKVGLVQFFVTSPIIGTVKFICNFNAQLQNQKQSQKKTAKKPASTQQPMKQNTAPNTSISLSIQKSQTNLILSQQSIYLMETDKGYFQLTPTHFVTPKHKFTISELFDSTTQSIIGGCIVGNFLLLAVQKQVHVFTIQEKEKQKDKSKWKPKCLHIFCFDCDIKRIIGLNNINIWGVWLWDGTFEYFRISDKQSIKMGEITQSNYNTNSNYNSNANEGYNQNYFNFNVSINTAPYTFTLFTGHLLICSNDPLHIYQPQKINIRVIKLNSYNLGELYYPFVELSPGNSSSPKSKTKLNNDRYTVLSNIGEKWMLVSFATKYLVNNIEDIKIEVEQIIGFPNVQNSSISICVVKQSHLFILGASRIYTGVLQTGSITYPAAETYKQFCQHGLIQNKSQAKNKQIQKQKEGDRLGYLRRWLSRQEIRKDNYQIEMRQGVNQISIQSSTIIKLSQSKILLHNQKQIWYASITSSNNSNVKNKIYLISYFSMPNDSFIQFRNNLGVHQLDNQQFMQIFAQKLPILSVARVSGTIFAILYSKMVVVVQVQPNGALMISQQIMFKDHPGLISVQQFIGVYDQMSIYLKDSLHRLLLLKYDQKTNKHSLQILEQLQDEIVNVYRVRGWKEKVRKVDIQGNQKNQYQKIVVKKDGQLIIGKQTRPIYI